MYLSRLTFATPPGHTSEVEEKLRQLRDLVSQARRQHVLVLRSHFASRGGPDLVFEQEVPDLATLEGEIGKVTGSADFQALSLEISKLLSRGPKREVYEIRSTPRKISRGHGAPHLLNFIHDKVTLRYRTPFSVRASTRVTQMLLRKVLA